MKLFLTQQNRQLRLKLQLDSVENTTEYCGQVPTFPAWYIRVTQALKSKVGAAKIVLGHHQKLLIKIAKIDRRCRIS